MFIDIKILPLVVVSFIALVSPSCYSQGTVHTFEVYTLDSVNIDSIRIAGTVSGEDLYRVDTASLKDSCNSVQIDFIYKGCGGSLTRPFDTTIAISFTTNRIIGYSILDTSKNCGFPDTPIVSVQVLEWTSCAQIYLREHQAGSPLIHLYPNPASDFVLINAPAHPEKISLFTSSGKLINERYFTNKINIPSGVSNQVLILEIVHESRKYYQQILIKNH